MIEQWIDTEPRVVFDRYWFLRYQSILLWLINSPLTRRWFRHVLRIHDYDCPPEQDICQILPSAYTVMLLPDRQGHGCYRTDFRTADKFSRRLYYAFRWIWVLFHLWDCAVQQLAPSLDPALNLGFDTLTQYPGSSAGSPYAKPPDGYLEYLSDDTSWASIRGASVANGVHQHPDTWPLYVSAGTNSAYYALSRFAAVFDTSSIGSGSTVVDAVFSIYYDSTDGKWDYLSIAAYGDLGVNLVTSNPANPNNNTGLVGADYATFGTTELSWDGPRAYSGFSSAAYYAFNFKDSALSNISQTAQTKLGLRLNCDFANRTPNNSSQALDSGIWFYGSGHTGTTNDPKLVVTYSTGTTKSVDYLVVGGGGAGGASYNSAPTYYEGGGGGGGEVRQTTISLAPGAYAVKVGSGGSGVTSNTGNPGTYSALNAIRALPGNGGSNFGSGGNSGNAHTGGAAGNSFNQAPGGGGGGNAANGSNGSGYSGGGGGAGTTGTIDSVVYAAGGGGAGCTLGNPPYYGAGGSSGQGGHGGTFDGTNTNPGAATAGATNTGSGGGGGASGGNGAAGIVKVQYLTADFDSSSSGGTKSTNGSYTIHTFTADGTLTLVAAASATQIGPVTETGAGTDAVSIAISSTVAEAGSTIATQAVSIAIFIALAVAEATGTITTEGVSSVGNLTPSESANITTQAISTDGSFTIAEATGGIVTSGISIVIGNTVNEASPTTESASLVISSTVTESGAGTDAAVPANNMGAVTEATGTVTTQAVALTINSTSTEAGAGSEAQSIAATLTVGDTGAGSEAINVATVTVAETGAGSEAVSIAGSFTVAEATGGVTTQSSIPANNMQAVTETGAGADAVSVGQFNYLTVTEAANITTEGTSTVGTLTAINEAAFTTESASPQNQMAAVTEATGTVTTQTVSIAIASTVTESGAGTDSASPANNLATVNDASSVTEACSIAIASTNTESGAGTEAVSSVGNLTAINEASFSTEAVTITVSPQTVTEATGMVTTQAISLAIASTSTETGAGTDSASPLNQMAAVTEATGGISTQAVTVVEILQVAGPNETFTGKDGVDLRTKLALGAAVLRTGSASSSTATSISKTFASAPPAGLLLIGIVATNGWPYTDCKISDDKGLGFVKVSTTYGGADSNNDTIHVFVATRPTDGTVPTVVFEANNNASWSYLRMEFVSISDIRAYGVAAVKQVGKAENQAYGIPFATFGSTTQADALVIAAVTSDDNAVTRWSPPATGTELVERNGAGSYCALEIAVDTQASGYTTLNWGSNSGGSSKWGAVAVELFDGMAVCPAEWPFPATENVSIVANVVGGTDQIFGADTPSIVSISGVLVGDTGAGTDTALPANYLGTVTESGLGAETRSIQINATITETGAGSEAVSIAATTGTVTESGLGAEGISSIGTLTAINEASPSTESAIPSNLMAAVTESWTGADTVTNQLQTTLNEASSVTENISTVGSTTITEAGAGSETVSAGVTSSVADTWTGTDGISIAIASTIAEASGTIATQAVSSLGSFTSADNWTGSDGVAFLVNPQTVSEATGTITTEGISIAGTLTTGDTGAGTEGITYLNNAAVTINEGFPAHESIGGDCTLSSQADGWTGTEAVSSAGSFTVAGTGAGTDLAIPANNLATVNDAWTGTEVVSIAATITLNEAAPTTQAISSTGSLSAADSGVGSEGVTSAIASTSSETWVGTEAQSLAISSTVVEAGAGSDIAQALLPIATVTESGLGAESVSLGISSIIGESGAGTDSAFALEPLTATTEVGLGTESQSIAIATTVGDIGAGSDLAVPVVPITVSEATLGTEVQSLAIASTCAESGAGADAVNVVEPLTAVTESGLGSDTQTIAIASTSTEGWSGTDTVTVQEPLTVNEAWTSTESVDTQVGANISQVGAGTDAVSINATLILTAETGLGAALADLTANLAAADASTVTEAVNVQATAAVDISEAWADNESVNLLVTLSETTTGGIADDCSLLTTFLVAEAGIGSQAVAQSSQIAFAESGLIDPEITIVVPATASESGAGTDTVVLLVTISRDDQLGSVATFDVVASLTCDEATLRSGDFEAFGLSSAEAGESWSATDEVGIVAQFVAADLWSAIAEVEVVGRVQVGDGSVGGDSASKKVLFTIPTRGRMITATFSVRELVVWFEKVTLPTDRHIIEAFHRRTVAATFATARHATAYFTTRAATAQVTSDQWTTNHFRAREATFAAKEEITITEVL